MSTPAFILLNPGPINVSARVRRALAECPDQCHREREPLEMQGRVRERLVRALGVESGWEAALLTGSGTAAMEAMVASCAGEGMLVVDNGVYGDRLVQMAEAHRIRVERHRVSWFERPDPAAVGTLLAQHRLDTLAVVHHETTTGLLNDLPALSAVARQHGARFLVDSVSGLAGEALDFAAVAPDAVCCTANKCIQGLPGISFVLVRKGLPLARRSVYLDLGLMLAKQRAGDTPFTPAIQVLAAFEAALDELLEETVAGRIARYRRAGEHVRATATRLGLEMMLPPSLRSHTITSFRLPAGVDYPRIHDRMREDGFVIYGGQGDLSKVAFRIANMGLIPDEAWPRFDRALARAIQ
ncbi:MAG: pyridoxal-phosphate-dependent aminotransferase family protein [Planctomycetia bacterium]